MTGNSTLLSANQAQHHFVAIDHDCIRKYPQPRHCYSVRDQDDAQVKIDALSVKVTKAGVDITAQVTRTQNGMSVDIGHVPTGATVSYVTVDAGGLPPSITAR